MSDSLSLTQQPEPGPPSGPLLQKSPGVAFFLSLIVPGLGHLYCGKRKAGLITFSVFAGSAVGSILLLEQEGAGGASDLWLGILLRTAIILYGYAFLDAFFTARDISSGRDWNMTYNPRIAAVLNLTTRGFGYFYVGEKKRGILFFLLVGLLSKANLTMNIAALDFLLEFVLIGLAADAYRIAVKLNPPEEPVPGPIVEEARSGVTALVYSLAGLMVVGYFGLAAWGYLSPDFEKIDQSGATFQVSNDASVYENLKYGITLRLPGKWSKAEEADADSFCELEETETGTSVIFSAGSVFPFQSVEGFSSSLREVLLANEALSLKLEREELVSVGTLSGRRLILRSSKEQGLRQAYLVTKKGLAVYYVIVTSGQLSDEQWKNLVDAIPGTLTIR